jgi:hypothetical protein
VSDQRFGYPNPKRTDHAQSSQHETCRDNLHFAFTSAPSPSRFKVGGRQFRNAVIERHDPLSKKLVERASLTVRERFGLKNLSGARLSRREQRIASEDRVVDVATLDARHRRPLKFPSSLCTIGQRIPRIVLRRDSARHWMN